MTKRVPQPIPPPQDRHRAVAELDLQITHAEETCAGHRHAVERSKVAGRENRVSTAWLRLSEERLAHLQRSRQTLLGGDEGLEGKHEEEGAQNEKPRRRPKP